MLVSRFPFILAASLVLLARPDAQADGLTKADVAKLGKAATVFVVAKSGTGTGFCVQPSGLFVTNEHIIGSDAEVTIVLNASLKDQKVLKAKVLRTDKQLDLALLQVEGQKDLPALSLGTVDKLAELADVIACGFPFGQTLAPEKNEYPAMTINAGSVTSLRLKAGSLHQLQLDVELNPGNSGGAVLDMNAKVIGVVASGIRGARVNFAIPVTHVTRFVERPDILFTAPTLTHANAHDSVEFRARVVSVLPPSRPIDLELVLRAGEEPERRLKMELKDGVYRVSAVPVPREAVRRLELSAQFETGAVEGLVEDQDIQVGAQKVKLSACKRVQWQPKPVVFLADGKSLEGVPTGLDKIAVAVGGQTLTVNLGRATSMVVQATKPVAAVECILVARLGDKEVGRYQTRLRVEGVTLIEPADPASVVIRPPGGAVDKQVKTLPGIASDIAVGGGGRYLVLHLPKLKKLAIFDVNEAKITRYVPLTEDKVVYAAGLEKLVVGLTAKGILERWDLQTGEKELTRSSPGAADIGRVLIGSASRGPVLVNDTFVGLDTLKPLPIKFPDGFPAPWSPVAADGTVFGSWKPNQSPAESTTFVLQGDELKRYNEGGMGHVVPGPDGRMIYTAVGPRTNQLKGVRGAPAKPAYCLPAVEGDFFLSLTPAEGGQGGRLGVYLPGIEQPLVKDAGFDHGIHFDSWDRNFFGPWKRIFFVPRAKLVIVFPDGNDRLELHRLDVDEALDKSGLDYLLVTSRPPATAKRGAEYMYQVVVKSKKGQVKYQIDSGPEGLRVSPEGLIKWQVPADFKGAGSDVILTVRDASGQEAFHTFTIRVTD